MAKVRLTIEVEQDDLEWICQKHLTENHREAIELAIADAAEELREYDQMLSDG